MNRVNRGWTVFCISSCLRVCHSQLKLSKRPKEADEKDRDKTAEAVLRGRVSVQKRRSRLCTILPKGRKRAWGVKGESSKLYHLQMQTRHGRSKKSWHLGLLNFFVFIWKKMKSPTGLRIQNNSWSLWHMISARHFFAKKIFIFFYFATTQRNKNQEEMSHFSNFYELRKFKIRK